MENWRVAKGKWCHLLYQYNTSCPVYSSCRRSRNADIEKAARRIPARQSWENTGFKHHAEKGLAHTDRRRRSRGSRLRKLGIDQAEIVNLTYLMKTTHL